MPKPVLTFAGSAASAEQFPRDGLPEVAFLGRSNVGKSSLLNALAGAPGLARVSSRPGRTRLLNFFRVDGTGGRFYLVDLPGYGYAEVPEAMRRGWEGLVTSYLVGRPSLALCIFIVDARHEPTAGDETLGAFLDDQRLPYVVAASKADALGRGDLARRRAALQRGLGRRAVDVLPVSARTRLGLPGLWQAIRAAVDDRREDRRNAGDD